MRKQPFFYMILFLLLLPHAILNAQNETLGDIRCGDIVEGEIVSGQSKTIPSPYYYSQNELSIDDYSLAIQAGTRVNLTIQPLGNTFNVAVALVDSGGNDVTLLNAVIEGQPEEFIDFQIGSSNQVLRILGAKPGSVYDSSRDSSYFYDHRNDSNFAGLYFGAYEIRLGCTLRDGTVIEPGDNFDDGDPAPPGTTPVPPTPVFSGFGFPGIAPVDFANGIEIPIQTNQSYTVPVGGDIVALYSYDATANSTATLNLSRVSGDISIGVTVIKHDTNEILFVGGLPSSNNLSVELTFPSDGTYAIGLFRMDTAERAGTSGAVQISLE